MKVSKISILIVLSILYSQVLTKSDVGNIVFYGRGQGSLATHWCTTNNIKSSSGVNIYFPVENEIQDTDKFNIIKNNPMIVYMPTGGKKDYSFVDFGLANTNIDLLDFQSFRAELRISVPKIEDLIAEGYTCESIGLKCTNLKDYDFSKDESKWLSKVDLKFYLESNGINTNNYYTDEERDYYRINLISEPLTTTWSEYEGKIEIQNYYEQYPYTNLVIRNYGSMPINIHFGNSIFRTNKIIPLLVEGMPANGYTSYSWLINGADMIGVDPVALLLDDPEKKTALYYSAANKADYAYYVHNTGDSYGPPEGISFKIMAYHVNHFKIKLDNIKEFNLTTEFVLDRNCKIPNEKEVEILIDIRSLVYADSFHMMTNDINGYILQAFTDSNHVTELLRSSGKSLDEANDQTSRVYYYTFDIHNTYPTDLSKYTTIKYDSKLNKECDISSHYHNDWEGKSYQWPSIINSADKFYKHIINVIDDTLLNDESDLPDEFATAVKCQEGLKIIQNILREYDITDQYSCVDNLLQLYVIYG
ncbi:hypothetical protein PIROE2DRAFT_17830 [Piromyces sp. E2]|nr:hypothetical protein PIROE2DRAFT_17830 [Piromyces sp. E2]|eukprot:OUM57242.1 hypothetical protein PIROE2DRAFT_17830 [Piromyces sp. E2]